MPIAIKEIFLSDSISELSEKLNFNFDQIVLAGGGPPGPIGIQGIQGPVGVQGTRGDHWFVGATTTGLTADHDGLSPLEVQDLFLDSNGNVYKYFEIGGSTGWTASGINIKGPTGNIGATGSSLEWNTYLADTDGNPVSPYGYLPSTNLGSSINTDFFIPVNSYKNSIFIGDQNWSSQNLGNFGVNPYTPSTGNQQYVPKFTIIQKEVNGFGINGLSFGAYGATSSIIASSSYGDTNSITDAFNFVHASFINELVTGGYQTKWKISSIKTPIKIQAGNVTDPNTYPDSEFLKADLELIGSNIFTGDYTNDSSVKIYGITPVSISSRLGGSLRQITINSKSKFDNSSISSTSNIFGSIILQNESGINNLTAPDSPEHSLGNVIIGPTFNSTGDSILGVATPQGLGIVRRITRYDTNDAGLRFFYNEASNAGIWNLGSNPVNRAKTATISSFTPIRITDSNIGSIVLDTLTISVGQKGIPIDTGSLQVAGRFAITNQYSTVKPQFPFHVNLSSDNGIINRTRSIYGSTGSAWDGSPFGFSNLAYIYTGFDIKDNSSFEEYTSGSYSLSHKLPGIGIGNSNPWYDGYGSTWDDVQGYDTGSFVSSKAYTNPIIQTYYRNDGFNTQPLDGVGGRSQGINTPHLYLQPGSESNQGNIGIGFQPAPPSYSDSSSYNGGSFAMAKLSIEGSVVIGSTARGYHKIGTNRIPNAILIDEGIIQGATSFSNQFGTVFYGGTAVRGITGLRVGSSFSDALYSRVFVSRGPSANYFPDYALPDLKTGMAYFNDSISTGWLVASGVSQTTSLTTGPSATSVPKKVASWKAKGETAYASDFSYSSFKVEDTLSMRTATYTTSTIPIKYTNYNITENSINANFKRIWYVIPSNVSTVFLDLSLSRSNFEYFNSSGNIISDINKYLNGAGLNLFNGNVGGWRSWGWTVEEGHYDGQILRIMVLDVDKNNASYIESSCTRFSSSSNEINALTMNDFTDIPDRLVLAADPTYIPANNIINDRSTKLNNFPLVDPDGINSKPAGYPFPFGYRNLQEELSSAFIPGNFPLSPNVTNNIPGTTNLRIGNFEYNMFTPSWSSGIESTVYSETGIGLFRILPYRSLTLQWKFDSTPISGVNGAWYEIGRENLVPRKTRNYRNINTSGGVPTP